MIGVDPAENQPTPPRLGLRIRDKDLAQLRQPLRKIRQQLRRHFALVSTRAKDVRNCHPLLGFAAHSSRISSVKRLRTFIPAAPSSVRTALAVRPCRPITLPRSSGCTRNSKIVACEPSTDLTCTSSGWSTRALAMDSTSSFIGAPLGTRLSSTTYMNLGKAP